MEFDGSFKKTVSGNSSSRHGRVTLYSITRPSSGSYSIRLVKASGTMMLLDALRSH